MSITAYSTTTQLTTLDTENTLPLVMAWLGSFSSAKTREAYSYDLRRFAEYLEHHKAGGLLEAKRAHIDMFARSLESADYSAATRAQ
jgi:site-specific recombinase XerD